MPQLLHAAGITGESGQRFYEAIYKRDGLEMKANVVITVAVIVGVGGLMIFAGFYTVYKRFAQVMSPDVPIQLKEARIVFGADKLVKSKFTQTSELGEERSMSYLDSSRGPELVVVGKNGASFIDENGRVKSSISFAERVDTLFGLKTGGDISRSGDVEIVDVDGDGLSEFLVRNDLGTAELIGHDGLTIWKYKGGDRKTSFLEDFAVGLDHHRDLECVAAHLNGKGLVLFDRSLNEKWEMPDVQAKHVEVSDVFDTGSLYVVHDDYDQIVVRSLDGEIVTQADLHRYVGTFSLVRWPTKKDKLSIINLSDGVIRMFDFSGRTLAEYNVPDGKNLVGLHCVTVKLTKSEPEYLAVLIENRSLDRAVLYVFDSTTTLIYEEILPKASAAIATLPIKSDDCESLVIANNGEVNQYQRHNPAGAP